MTHPSVALARVVRRIIQPRYPLSKKQVVEVQCERCPRKEYVDPTTKAAPPIVITVGTTVHKFEDLCASCRSSVEASIAGIVKKLDGRSPERKAKKGVPAEAAPPPPPNGAAAPSKATPPPEKRTGPAPARTT
jgi:hypothetical protein